MKQKYFYGHKISQYGVSNGYLDYGTLANVVDHVLCNEIVEKFYFETVNCAEEDYTEIFQWYIVSEGGARILLEVGEPVFYNEELDMYVWGVTHFGTAWDYVLTNYKLGEDHE